MDVEQMKADLGPGAVFDIGEENTASTVFYGRMLLENAYDRRRAHW